MKTQSNISIPDVQLWKEGQWMIAVNQVDRGYLPTDDPLTDKSGSRYEADFTIVDAQTAEAAMFAFTRMTQDVILDNKVIHNIEHEGKEAIKTKPVYASKVATTIFKPLPATGNLKKGEIYSYNNGAVMVVQDHERTIYAPELTPALFSFYRTVTEGQEWIVAEDVIVNATRTYKDKTYKCIQAHQTQEGWNPELTINVLWQLVVVTTPATKPPQWVTGDWAKYTPVGYEVFDGGKVWKVKTLTHTWIQPALTGNGAISWTFVKDWV